MAFMFDLSRFDVSQFEASAAQAAKLLRALANERRLMILCQLADGERSVGQIQPLVGLSQSALSQHLAVLREEGVVAASREGPTLRSRIAARPPPQGVGTLAEIFCPPAENAAHDAHRESSEA